MLDTVRTYPTLIGLEEAFWLALDEIAHENGTSLSALIDFLEEHRRPSTSLRSAIRVHVITYVRARLDEALDGGEGAGDRNAAARRNARLALS